MVHKILLALGVIAATLSLKGQETCSSSSRMSYEWPSHKNWGLADNLGRARVFNSATGAVTTYGSGIRAYEGTASASDDAGNFLFFANGRILYNSTGGTIYTGLLTGNEGGNTTGSAAQGIAAVRHPLNPDKYYFITTDDALTGATNGLNYAVVDKNGTVDQTSTRLGSFRTTEGIAVTWHANEVDIWITVTQAGSTNIISYLLRCDGFETDPSISPAISAVGVATGAADQERGGLAFSHDSQQFAAGLGGTTGADKVRLYDFDNATGLMTYNRGIGSIFGIYAPYDLQFSPDDSRVLASSSYGHVYSLNTANGVGTEVAGLTWSHSAIEIGADGNLYRATMVGHGGPLNKLSGNLNNGSALTVSTITNTYVARGLNTMFLPPAEEPDIQEVGPYCNTDPAVDLSTTWICAGTDAEDPTNNPLAYTGDGITDRANGTFDPATAGVGTHQIVFEYCSVNDTIWIEVTNCITCEAELDDVQPEICVGETYTLDGLVTNASADGVWTIDSVPAGTSPVLTTGADTIFDASNLNVTDGTYKLLFTVTDGGETCYDSVYIVVNPLPTPDLGNDTSICIDASDVVFDAGTYSSYLWQPNGEITQTISTSTAGEYIVTVTDANGCEANDSVVLTVNPLPTPDLGNDTSICIDASDVVFDAGTYASYLWQPNGEVVQTISTSTAGEYIVTVTDANGCEANDSVVLTVNPLPTPDLGNDTAICIDASDVVFDAGTYSSYLWQPNGEVVQTISTSTAGEYIVTVTDANGCEANDSVVLTVNPLPTPDLGNDTAICIDASDVVFDAGTYSSYLWQPNGEITQTISTSTAGEYIVTVTDANGCEANDTVVLTVNPLPTPDLGVDSTICFGDGDVVFDAGTYASYLWQPNGEITQTISTSTAGEYILTVTDANGCEANDSVVLTVNPLPTPDLGNDTSICIDASDVVFDAGTYSSYLWQPNGEITQTISTSTAGEYIVTVTDANGCEANDTVVLTVNPLPTPDLGNDTAICIDASDVVFDAGTYSSYLWQPNGEITQTISTSTAGEYIVTVTDANGCEANDSVVLTVNPLPTPDLGNDTSICIDASDVVFDAGTYSSYLWQPNGEITQTISTSTAGEYIVTVTDVNGCEANDSVVLTVNPLPTPDLGNDTSICIGASDVVFDAGTYSSYLWQPNGEIVQTISTSTAGEYIVTVTDANGCEANDSVVLTVNPLPTPDLGNDTAICIDASDVVFDAGTYSSYLWQPNGEITQTISTSTAGEYIVTVTDANGCEANDSVVLTVNPLPTPDLGVDSTICFGDGDVTFDAGTYSSYFWQPNGEVVQTISTSTAGEYIVTVTDANGCEANDSVVLTVNPLPTPDLGNDTAICLDASDVVFDAGTYSSYLWQPNGEITQTISTSTAGEYIVTVTDANGCEANDTVVLTVNPLPTPDLGVDSTICFGDGDVVFDAGTYSSYLWQPNGEITQTISTSTAGEYIVTVTDANGCEANDTVVLTVNPLPTPDLGNDTAICIDASDVVFDAGTYSSYLWQPNGEITQTISTSTAGEYIVTVTDANGCEANDSVVLTVNPLPTPDLGNDTSICIDASDVVFDAGTYNSYLWQPNGEITQTISTSTAGEYIVTVTDVNGCEANDTVVLTVNPLPTPDLGADSTICFGDGDVVFDAGTYSSYLWQPNGEITQTISTSTAGEYIVTVTDANGCEANDTVELTVNPLPTPDLGNDTSICIDASDVVFDAGTYSSYLWQPNGEITQTISTSTAGEYIVTVTDANGCEANDSVVLTVNPLPTPDLGNDTAICIDASDVVFDAGTYSSYLWQPNGEITQTIPTSTAGEYIVTVTDANGCEANDTVVLTVNPLPTPDLGVDSTICFGDGDVTFDAGVYSSYLWQPNGEITQTISTSAAGEYIVAVTDANGCEANDTVVLTVNPLPTPDLGVDKEICDGGLGISFDAGVYSSYLWQPNGETTQTITTNTSGDYIVSVVDANGCEANDTVNLIVNDLPSVDLGSNVTICPGSQVVLDAGPDFATYMWSDASMLQTVNVSDANAGEFTVLVIDTNGCIARDTVEVIVATELSVDLGLDTAFCDGNTITLDAGGVTGGSYIWQPNGEITQTINVSTSGTYSVEITDLMGCSGRDTIVITVNTNPTVDLGPDVSVCPTFDSTFTVGAGWSSILWNEGSTTESIDVSTAGTYYVDVVDVNGCTATDTAEFTFFNGATVDLGSDITICPGTSANFDAGTFASYTWHSGATIQTYTGTTEETVSVEVVDADGCIANDTAEIFMATSLPIDLGNDTAVCDGETVILDAGYPVTGYTFLWNTGATTPTIKVSTAGTYGLVVQDVTGCSGSDSINITINANPTVDLGPDVSVCPTFDSTFTVGTGWSSILWNEGSTTESIAVSTAGTYYVDVVDVNGCTATDTAEFTFFNGATVDLGSDITICPGTSANFDAGTFASYTWHSGATIQTYTGTTEETVSVEVIDNNGCIAHDTAEIIMALSLPVNFGNDTSICSGETVLVNSGYPATGYTFLWNTGATTPTITVSTAGTYGVVVQDVTGCSGSDSIDVLINNLPVVNLGPDKSICAGDSTTFDANSGWNTIMWSTTETAQIIGAKTDGDYIVTVTDNNGCEDADTVNLTINTNPIVDLGNDQTVCPGSTALFNAGSFASYTWQDASLLSSYSSAVEEVVYVTVVDVNGCVGSDTAEVFVRTALLVDLGPDTAVCEGNSVTINSGYSNINGFSWNTGSTGESITVTTTGIYGVEVTDVNGCTGTDSITVTINSNPTVDLGPNQAICEGDSVIFDAGTNWQSVEWNDLSTSQTITVNSSGTYSVTVADANGCIGTDAVDLIVNQNPTVSLGNDVEVCPGNNVTFKTTPNNFIAYEWQNGSTGSTFETFNPQEVSVIATDINGCIAMDTAVLTNLPALEVNLPADQQFCEGGSYTITVPGYDPANHTYLWSTGSTQSTITVTTSATYNVFVSNGGGCAGFDTIRIDVNPNPTPSLRDTGVCVGEIASFDAGSYTSYAWTPNGESTQTITASDEGTYRVSVVDSNGCAGTGSANLTVYSKPVIPAFADKEACEGQEILLNPTLPLGTYLWLPSQETTSSISVGVTGSYSVSVTNVNGCTDSISMNALFNPNPTIDLGSDRSICEGESVNIGSINGVDVIAWNIGIVADVLEVKTSGEYIATITDSKGCSGKDTINVVVNSNPSIKASPDTIVCMQEIGTFDLEVSSGNREQFDWSTGESGQQITINTEGTYYVTATNDNGCSTSDTIVVGRKCVSTIFVANAFTPNGDGTNDRFGPVGLNIYDFDFYVFDRWGEEIFHSSDMNDKWDGTYKGNDVQVDVYVWKVYYKTEEDYGGLKFRTQVGTVTVLR